MNNTPQSDQLHTAARGGFFSTAQFQKMPEGFPFHVAVSAIALPDGCIPPGNAPQRRFAVGKSEDKDETVFLALMEAAERFSIQYSSGLPPRYTSFKSFGADLLATNTANLTLGAPDTNGQIRSIGSAAGQYLEDASLRAILELLEHYHVDMTRGVEPSWQRIEACQVPELGVLSRWLDTQLRMLDCRCQWFKDGYAVAVCACTDLNGGRRTLGSSAKTSTAAALKNATYEAVFHWRNMVALEFHGRAASGFTGDDLRLLEEYRGSIQLQKWPDKIAATFKEECNSQPDVGALATAYTRLAGGALHLFDLTHKTLKIPVVRAVPQQSG